MTIQPNMAEGIDYAPCQYGTSRLVFRGPEQDLSGVYVAFIGSTATFGKRVQIPFPAMVEEALGLPAVNLGAVNAGTDTFCQDPTVRAIMRDARACVIQVMGAHKLSNPFYSVHPRRNDRVVAPSKRLKALYPDVDFTDIHFARHLITTLYAVGPDRFEAVRNALRATWVARMGELLAACDGPTVLVDIHAPDQDRDAPDGPEPLFVTEEMFAQLTPEPTVIVETKPDQSSVVADIMMAGLPTEATHTAISDSVSDALRWVL